MARPLVIIHERQGSWSRRLRHRFDRSTVRWAETRSTSALVEASRRSACPMVVLDLGDHPERSLEDLDALTTAAPDAFTLVLDPGSHPDVAPIARELGATLVLPGVVVPPEVAALLRRWLPLAGGRVLASGWWPKPLADPEPWESPG